MRLFKVALGGFEPWLWADYGDLKMLQKNWTQQPAHWSLFFVEHPGVVSINNRPIPFQSGNVVFVAPGTKVSFDKVGEGTFHYHLSFGLVPRTETVTIPAVIDLGELTEVRRAEIKRVMDWIHVSIMPDSGSRSICSGPWHGLWRRFANRTSFTMLRS